MAKNVYNNETFLRGRVGKLVYKVVRGKQVVAPFAEAQNPNTPSQRRVRDMFSIITKVAGSLKFVLKVAMKAYARSRRSTPAAMFVKANYDNGFMSHVSPFAQDYEKMIVALGNDYNIALDEDHIDQTSVPGTISIAVQERMIDPEASNENDKCYLAAYCPELEMGMLGEPKKRSEVTELEVTPPTYWNGHKVYLYNFTTNPENTSASESKFVGSIDFVIE